MYKGKQITTGLGPLAKVLISGILIFPTEADMKVTLGSRPPCTKAEGVQFWFDAAQKGLYLCANSQWVSVLTGEAGLGIHILST